MPSKVDPRTDDGKAPTPPKNVHYSVGSGSISFNASGSPDVVGYRLFKSVNGSPYTHQGQVILGDESLVFSGLGADGVFTTYYVVAVDVAGKTSEPSAIVGGTTPGFPLPGDTEANPDDTIDQPDGGITEEEPGIDPGLGNEGATTVPSAPGQPTLTATRRVSRPPGAETPQKKRSWSTISISARTVTGTTRFSAPARARSSTTPRATPLAAPLELLPSIRLVNLQLRQPYILRSNKSFT